MKSTEEYLVCETCGDKKENPLFRYDILLKKGTRCGRCLKVVDNPLEHGLTYCPLEKRVEGMGLGVNESMQRDSYYKKTIAKGGVKGKDLIQPYLKSGDPNPDFLEHYPDKLKEFPTEQRENIENRYGKN